jgi:hypothetical protein
MRGLGKAEQTINVKEGAGPAMTYSLDQLIAAVQAAGGDPHRFPQARGTPSQAGRGQSEQPERGAVTLALPAAGTDARRPPPVPLAS